MIKITKPFKIERGQIVIYSEGEYSDYNVQDYYLALKDFDQNTVPFFISIKKLEEFGYIEPLGIEISEINYSPLYQTVTII